MIDPARIRFIQARHWTPGQRTAVDLVVIHTAEVPQEPGIAANVARGFATTERLASAHYVVDDGPLVYQCVREDGIAWHAPGANRNGIGIELCGRASTTAEEWAAPYSAAMLATAAELVAEICRRWSIPAGYATPLGLLDGKRGITGHAAVSSAFRKSTHSDPGLAFPWPAFVESVARRLTMPTDSPPSQ